MKNRRAECVGTRIDRGFTIVELLVVVAILGVLVAILMPSISRARETARRQVCASNLKQFGLATMMYAQDNKNDAPDASGYPLKLPGADWNTYGRFCVDPYLRQKFWFNYGLNNVRVWICPSALNLPYDYRHLYYNERYFRIDPTLQASSLSDNHWALTPYAYFAGPGRTVKYTVGGVVQRMTKIDKVQNPSMRMVWADLLTAPTSNVAYLTPNLYYFANTHTRQDGTLAPEGGNYVMADGHGEWREYRYGDNVVDYGASANWTHFIYQYYSAFK